MELSAKCSFLAIVSGFSLLVTFDTVWLLATFLSYHPLSTRNDSACQESLGESKALFVVFEALLKDGLLLVLFILQHSLMAHINMQRLLDKIGLGVLTRCVYVLASCASLQVLYYVRGLPDPLKSKSEGLLRYYKHMRHPSFIGFSLLFWGIPQMSLDRALLALQLTIYMFLAWNTDERDIDYLRYQLEDKEAHENGDWHHATYIRKQH
ncbi:nurim isoform X2 [Hetaerina americana]|uniref:nurim isoform X2 n=1 Tax=Hetaerina americana TaxID=62018 RepID=UPI003A7F220E